MKECNFMKIILGTSINHDSKARMISHHDPKVEFIFNLLHTFFYPRVEVICMRFCFHFFLALIKINIKKLAQQKSLV